jgi:hypothetical protein
MNLMNLLFQSSLNNSVQQIDSQVCLCSNPKPFVGRLRNHRPSVNGSVHSIGRDWLDTLSFSSDSHSWPLLSPGRLP